MQPAVMKIFAPVLALVCISGTNAQVPGVKTAADTMAASADGLSRYLARDGPIQPAITAIGGLPMRAGELINRGISRLSDGFGSGARSVANRAGSGEIKMPGMETLRNLAPAPVASMGSMIRQGISYKNGAIMNQAREGIAAGERLSGMMSGNRNV